MMGGKTLAQLNEMCDFDLIQYARDITRSIASEMAVDGVSRGYDRAQEAQRALSLVLIRMTNRADAKGESLTEQGKAAE